jgi:Carboxypeptidase regulatory-like domain/TonB dependent receptor
VLLLVVPMASAQNPNGGLVGSARDSLGARIPGAHVAVEASSFRLHRSTETDHHGEFRLEGLPPGQYQVSFQAPGFASRSALVNVDVGSFPTLDVVLQPAAVTQSLSVAAATASISSESIETTSSVIKNTVGRADLEHIPLAQRSFANIAYLTPMTEPVEPSDPTKARITAVSFGGSSGLNVDLSVDGGDNNDDYIGGFLQNYSPDAMQEFAVRTAQSDADTSRTNGGSIIISTRRGTDSWHGDVAGYFRGSGLNARNALDNPEPNPKQQFSKQDAVVAVGGPIVKAKLWVFSSLEYTREDASIGYSSASLDEFRALAQLANNGLIPGVSSIDVPSSVPVPFHDALFSERLDWAQSERSRWFLRGAFDLNRTVNDLVQQGTLPSTGATSTAHYGSLLLNQQYQFTPSWLGDFTFQGSWFDLSRVRNSDLGLALAFPFSANFHTTSGFETFGDNQFATPITAFPVMREQQKYQFRYDAAHVASMHSPKFGVNLVHEPVLGGALASHPETLVVFPQDPSFYVANPAQFTSDFNDPANQTVIAPGTQGNFSQNLRRLGVYAQDSWRIRPRLTINYGLRYDTTFGLFIGSGRDQNWNPALLTIRANGIALPSSIPHDYRGAVAPRLGIAYSPGQAGRTVIRAGVGMYYNDLAQNGWVDAFRAVNTPAAGLLQAGDQGAIIDPNYHTPYALQASVAVEHQFSNDWTGSIQYEHQQGVHQYRRYEYVGGVTLFNADGSAAPDVSVFRTDNRSQYDGLSFLVRHRFSRRFDLTAHYTLAKASTWGAVVGELFDYVNGVTDVRNPFGPGDHGPSGEDVCHRFVVAGTLQLPGRIELSTLSQFESARPFTLAMPVDVNNDGRSDNDRAVINGVPTSLDQFRGSPFAQVDLRIARVIPIRDRATLRAFVEFFNLFNRQNPGNNYVGDISALGVSAAELAAGNITHLCASAACTTLVPITNLNQVRVPAGALGDFFGPGTTVGIPFAAQLGVRLSF